MYGFGRRRREELQVEINMVPVMNMFLVLIPFLLLSSNFLPFNVINASVPVTAPSEASAEKDPIKNAKENIKITMVVKIKENGFELEGISEEIEDFERDKLSKNISRSGVRDQEKESYGYQELTAFLSRVKGEYPKSDTLILIPSQAVLYETIIKTMDVARKSGDITLFPNVVLSDEVS